MTLDCSGRTLKDRRGRLVELRYQSMSVLMALAAKPGEVVSRREIIEAAWSGAFVSEDSLAQCITDIRRALGDKDRRIVETIPRVGYRLVVSAAPAISKRRYAAAILLALAAIAAIAAYQYRWRHERISGAPVVAVLPFDDLSTANHAGFLGDAVSEGIIIGLARFPQIKVLARNSSFQFRGNPTVIRRVGKILGADYVIEGSQQFDGENLRVSVQLIEADSGTHVFSEMVDRRIGDLFDVQDEIVGRVTSAVGGSVLTNSPAKRSAGDVNSVLRGLQARKLMLNPTRENWRKALALEEKSIREDPNSPWGYIGKSLMLVNGEFQGWINRPRDEVLREAAELSRTALQMAPENYMSHYAMARVLTSRKEYAQSISHFERAVVLNPSDSLVFVTMSIPLLFTGKTERAISILNQAKSVDPLYGDVLLWQLGWAYWQDRECQRGLKTMLSMSSPPAASYTMLAGLYVCAGQPEKAKAAMKLFLKDRPGYTLADEITLNPPDWKPDGTLSRWLADMRAAGMPEQDNPAN